MPNTANIEAPNTVNSKVTGINAGQLFSGRPPMLMGYVIAATQYCRPNPVNPPPTPPISVSNGTAVHLKPTASERPSTGNGVYASTCLYPASRVFFVAASRSSGVENSPITPNSCECRSLMNDPQRYVNPRAQARAFPKSQSPATLARRGIS